MDEQLDRLFKKTKRLVLYGNALRVKSLAGTRFSSYGAWLSSAPQHAHLTADDKDDRCTKMSWAKLVFEDWEKIINNMSNVSYIYIDIRRFTLQQLNRARSPKWCNDENKRQSPKEIKQPVIPNFDTGKINIIMNCVADTGIVSDVCGEEEQLKLISQMIFHRMKCMNISEE